MFYGFFSLDMTNHNHTSLLTDEELQEIANAVEKWMREPEQWRYLLTQRLNILLADITARKEREAKVRELLESAYGGVSTARVNALIDEALSILLV